MHGSVQELSTQTYATSMQGNDRQQIVAKFIGSLGMIADALSKTTNWAKLLTYAKDVGLD